MTYTNDITNNNMRNVAWYNKFHNRSDTERLQIRSCKYNQKYSRIVAERRDNHWTPSETRCLLRSRAFWLSHFHANEKNFEARRRENNYMRDQFCAFDNNERMIYGPAFVKIRAKIRISTAQRSLAAQLASAINLPPATAPDSKFSLSSRSSFRSIASHCCHKASGRFCWPGRQQLMCPSWKIR